MKKIWVYIVFLLCFSSAIPQAKSIEFSQERKIYRNGAGNSKNTLPKSKPNSVNNSPKKTKPLKNVKTSKSFKKLNEKYLEEKGYNPHKFKEDVVGEKLGGKYNIHRDTETGELVLIRVQGKSDPIRTGEFIK